VASDVAIIVTDSPPLITLAAAQCLDYLLYPGLPVLIPDAVFHESTSAAGKLGAQEILDWYRRHVDLVRVEPTQAFETEILAREASPGRALPRDLGERAAIEVVREHARRGESHALLLSDDRDVERLVVVQPEQVILLTTWDYLRQLEEAQRIQSADAVMQAVLRAGRNPPRRDLWSQHDPETRDAVRAVIADAQARRG
jgi:hypothetical protein